MRCGDANPNGNVLLVYKGGCNKELDIKDAYRCTGCNGWFHKDCILEHFKNEKNHDWGRQEERDNVLKLIKDFSDGENWIDSEFDRGVSHGIKALKKYLLKNIKD